METQGKEKNHQCHIFWRHPQCLQCVFLFTDAYPKFHSLITRLDAAIWIDFLSQQIFLLDLLSLALSPHLSLRPS